MAWGIVPAAGAGSRIQPLAFSKELLPVGSRIERGAERPLYYLAIPPALFDDVIEGRAELGQKRDGVQVGLAHLLFHAREVGWLAVGVERRRRDQIALLVVAKLTREVDDVLDLDCLAITVDVFPRDAMVGDFSYERCGVVHDAPWLG